MTLLPRPTSSEPGNLFAGITNLIDFLQLGKLAKAKDADTLDGIDSSAFMPIGGMLDYPGVGDPSTSWLICDGRSLLRASYPTLFTRLGGAASPWGLPDGTHFNLPNPAGRASVGAGTGAGLTNRVLGTTGGEEAHALSIAELAAHSHGGVTGGQSVGHTHNMDHDHPLQVSASFGGAAQPSRGSGAISDVGGFGAGGPVKFFNGNTGAGSVDHTHPVTSQGSGTAHNVMQPWVALNKIIRVL